MSPEPTGWATTLRQCVLCGHEGSDVHHGLVRWREGAPFGSGPRCRDHDACSERCWAAGEPWPVDDGRPAGPVAARAGQGKEDELDFG